MKERQLIKDKGKMMLINEKKKVLVIAMWSGQVKLADGSFLL